MDKITLSHRIYKIQSLLGTIIEAHIADCEIGEICHIHKNWRDTKIVAKAQVLGFQKDTVILGLIGDSIGISKDSVIIPTKEHFTIKLSADLLGCVIDSMGNIVERLKENSDLFSSEKRGINRSSPSYLQRKPIQHPFVTGIKAIDGLITCGIGQRLGIFASAGCGKTSLMHMMIQHASADIFVIALIGERGRELTEFVDTLKQTGHIDKCIIVYATSNYSSIDRANAALVATTIAEYFRDQGSNVVLFLDSITRYSRALRDVALAAGEPPARRGYPTSVFEALPKLLERPGLTEKGGITAFYTILLESDDEPDPIAEEIRSILDGHIYLNRKLAEKSHYPAISILQSISRVASQICDQQHLNYAAQVRKIFSKIEELKIFIDLGEYKEGENSENDEMLYKYNKINSWLIQSLDEKKTFELIKKEMYEILS
ncbi:MAG: type III secretion system ATPase SctN [Arsenophonus endosymbiont of Dermacentor nuttalli]